MAVERVGMLLPGNLVLKHSEQPIRVCDPTGVVVDAAWDLVAHGAKVTAARDRSLT